MPSPRRKKSDRRKYLRRKRVEGTLTDEQTAELAQLETEQAEAHDVADEPGDASSDPVPGAEPTPDHAAPVPDPAPVQLPDPPPLPRPPKIDLAAEPEPLPGRAGKALVASTDWRDPWRKKALGQGREATVVAISTKLCDVLKFLDAQTVAAGADPLPFSIDDDLKPNIVLTVDRILPERVKLTPELSTVGGATAVIARRFIYRKQIGEQAKLAIERAKHDEFKRKQAERMKSESNVVPIRVNDPVVDEPKKPEPAKPDAPRDLNPDGIF